MEFPEKKQLQNGYMTDGSFLLCGFTFPRFRCMIAKENRDAPADAPPGRRGENFIFSKEKINPFLGRNVIQSYYSRPPGPRGGRGSAI